MRERKYFRMRSDMAQGIVAAAASEHEANEQGSSLIGIRLYL